MASPDALAGDGVRIASDAQAWVLKPAAFGGGDGNVTTTSPTLAQLGYTVSGAGATAIYENLNGDFTITPSATSVLIEGENADNGNFVNVAVYGTSPACIATAVASATIATAPAKPTGCTATSGSF